MGMLSAVRFLGLLKIALEQEAYLLGSKIQHATIQESNFKATHLAKRTTKSAVVIDD